MKQTISEQTTSPRNRLLDVAERLFSEQGYEAVTMRDIADAMGVRQASLYHHVPGGKQQLYVEVVERAMARHRLALEQAVASAGPHLRDQLLAASRWLLDHPPVDLVRMVNSDMPALSEEHSRRLTRLTFEALLLPLASAFRTARERGEHNNPADLLLAGSFLAMMDAVQVGARFSSMTKDAMANNLIDTLLFGLLAR
ncbi:MAG: hypothetical protein KatS3mg057_2691 [Herpetosiphonaceae bacterium]|nr:MAG: hypothetical protein KatS3mg057_2691 [Herpetosiphonaceae bacterium]